MFDWLKNFFAKKESENSYGWKNLLPGDHVRIWIKNPNQLGLTGPDRLTFQRLDAEDIRLKKVDGYVIRVKKVEPGPFDVLEISVIKKDGRRTRLIDYVLLKEEVERVEFLGERF